MIWRWVIVWVVWTAVSTVWAAIPALEPVPYNQLRGRVLLDERLWNDRQTLLEGIDSSLDYLRSSSAEQAYSRFSPGVTREHVLKSLERFRLLLLSARTLTELNSSLLKEFVLYRSANRSADSPVRFTGYFQPVYRASREATPEFRYPIFRPPPDYSSWRFPHPTRVQLEGYDGLGSPKTRGLAIAYLRSRFEVYMVQVQGSAILELDDGTRSAVGFAAGTNYPFTGVAGSMLKEGRGYPQAPEDYFARHPEVLNYYLSRNNRFVFFRENSTPDPVGCLGVPVVAERSIATDKAQLPPGALALIQTWIPRTDSQNLLRLERVSHFVLDHDTGRAIRGPRRVDIFMGTGREAQRKANHVYSEGELFYVLLK